MRDTDNPLQMLSRLVTWSPSSAKLSSRSILAWRRWLAIVAVVIATTAVIAGAAADVAVALLVASPPRMQHLLVPTDGGKIVSP